MARKPHPLIADLAEKRTASGLSVWAAARRAGLADAVIRDWEAGRCDPTLVSLEKYLAALGLQLVVSRSDTTVMHADAIRRLELETIPRPPSQMDLAPVAPETAAENRRILGEAMGFDDDMPVAADRQERAA